MRKRRFAAALLVMWLGAVSPVRGEVRQFSAEVDNEIRTGDISISIQEYEWDAEGRRIPYQDGKSVLPNERTVKIVTIVNEAEPSWIRAKAEFSGIFEAAEAEAGLEGIPDEWKKCGDYYYWTRPVNTGEEIDFFDHVRIPRAWSEADSEKGFLIDVTAQAVQRANFVPDFQSEDPWFGIPVEQCVHTDHKWYQEEKLSRLAVIFENGAEGFFKTGNDFFQGFPSLMPGDVMTDSFELGNRSGKPVVIQFSTRVPQQQEDSISLLKELKLKIQKGESVIYEGPLHGGALRDGIPLAELSQDTEEIITFSVSMPEQLQNQAAMKKARVQWIFSAEYNSPSRESGGGEGENSREEGKPLSEKKLTYGTISVGKRLNRQNSAGESVVSFLKGALPKTGDESRQQVFLMTGILSGGILLLLIFTEQKKGWKGRRENGFRTVGKWAAAGVFLTAVGISAAYLIYQDEIVNRIQAGENTISITEEFEPPKKLETGENIFKKRVQIENIDQTPCFVRVFMEFSDSDIKQRSCISPDGENWFPASDYTSSDFQQLPKNWRYLSLEEDPLLGGFYYYIVPVKPGERTLPLAEKLMARYENEEQIRDFDILVTAESVQTCLYEEQPDGSFTAADVSEKENGWRLAWTEYLERR